MDRNHPLKIVTLDNPGEQDRHQEVATSISRLRKGGYPHFMLKEIFEQPKTIVDCIRAGSARTYDVILSGIMDSQAVSQRPAHHLRGLRHLVARIAHRGVPDRGFLPHSGRKWNTLRVPLPQSGDLSRRHRDRRIAVGQKQPTRWPLSRRPKQNGAFVYGICNVIGSSIARATDSGTSST